MEMRIGMGMNTTKDNVPGQPQYMNHNGTLISGAPNHIFHKGRPFRSFKDIAFLQVPGGSYETQLSCTFLELRGSIKLHRNVHFVER